MASSSIVTTRSGFGLFALLSLFFLATLMHCRKGTPSDYYFECYINGKKFTPELGCRSCLNSRLLGDTLFLLGASYGPEHFGFYVSDYPVKSSPYKLGDEPYKPQAIYDSYNPSEKYTTRFEKDGWMRLEVIDKANRTIIV